MSAEVMYQRHPNTQAVLNAWERLSTLSPEENGPPTHELPGLVGRLFVLARAGAHDFPFRRASASLEQLFGRHLLDHDFQTLWSPSDRPMISAALCAAEAEAAAVIIRAEGETLTGRILPMEFVLAPLTSKAFASSRFLGLCQPLVANGDLQGRPVRRLTARAILPLHPSPGEPLIRIVHPA